MGPVECGWEDRCAVGQSRRLLARQTTLMTSAAVNKAPLNGDDRRDALNSLQ